MKEPQTDDAPQPPLIDVYYYEKKKDYVYLQPKTEQEIKDGVRDQYTITDKASVMQALSIYSGLSTKTKKDQDVSDAARHLIYVQKNFTADYVGGIAGWPTGYQTMGGNASHGKSGKRMLIIDPPKPCLPVKKEDADHTKFPNLWWFLSQAFGDNEGLTYKDDDGNTHAVDQLDFFCSWLAWVYHNLLEGSPGNWLPRQMMVIAGGTGLGKSFLQTHIIHEIIGRSARPYDFLVGKTTFNSELFKAEHLHLGDEEPIKSFEARHKYATALKKLVAEPLQYYHAKGLEADNLKPFWVVTMSVNEDDESIRAIPYIGPSFADKITILRMGPNDFSKMEKGEQEEIRDTIVYAELPYFCRYLLDYYILDKSNPMWEPRYGVRSWQHPEVREKMEQGTILQSVWRLIVENLNHGEAVDDSYDAKTIFKKVCNYDAPDSPRDRLLKHDVQSVGMYLKQLAGFESFDGGSVTRDGTKKWHIKWTPDESEEA